MAGDTRTLNRKALRKRIWEYRYIYLMLLLPVAYFFIFKYRPMYGLELAFKEYSLKGITASPWVGLDQFKRKMTEPEFFTAFWNTLIISFYKILWGFPFPILLAILISELRSVKYQKIVQTVLTFPHFLSWVILAGIVLNLLGDTGSIKKLVTVFNPAMIKQWNVLYDKSFFRTLLVSTDIWKEAGWGTIIYIAAMAGISPDLYEAAAIDGCNRFQKILYVTLPGLIGIIVIQLLLRVGYVMDGGFDQVFNLYSPPVIPTGDTIDTYIYRITFQRNVSLDFGFSTAVGLFKNVINFALLIIANTLSKRFGGESVM
jgi:putative aldouronate transport system permease protein